MPTTLGYGHNIRRWCQLPYQWSTARGGCRFEPSLKGPCKPERYRRA